MFFVFFNAVPKAVSFAALIFPGFPGFELQINVWENCVMNLKSV